MISGFEPIVDGLEGPLADAIRPAFHIRSRSAAVDLIRDREAAFDAAETAFLLESVDESAELHSFVLTILDGGGGVLLANRMVLPDATIFRLTEPDELVRTDIAADRSAEVADRVRALDVPEGAGGDTTVFGGDVQFLTLRRAGAEIRVILAGYQHAVLNPAPAEARDPADRQRQRVIDALYLLWADLAATKA